MNHILIQPAKLGRLAQPYLMVGTILSTSVFAILQNVKALFIHRSVGHNLIAEGELRQLLHAQGVALDDYDNNTGILTHSDNSIATSTITIPGNNTNPDNLAQYFMNWDTLLDDYDLIIAKSCYPNSRVKGEAQLEAIKKSYNAIFKTFKLHKKRLALLTSPPLRPLFTNEREAQLVGKLNEWLLGNSNEWVYILDFHTLLADTSGRHAGMLSRQYRRLLPFDNHPNKKASQELAPLVANFITGIAQQ